jgi:hypothetical protein
MDTDRNLLCGVLALQGDLIRPNQFVEACTTWANRNQMVRGYPGRARFVATSRYPDLSCTGSTGDRRNSFDFNAFRPMSRGFPDSLLVAMPMEIGLVARQGWRTDFASP